MKRALCALALAACAVAFPTGSAAAQQFRGQVPTAQQVIGINLGDRDVTTAESDRYLLAVDQASDRVTSGVAATSVLGRPLRYAIAGRPERVTASGLSGVRAAAAKLMDPRTSEREAARIAASDPAILWIAGNVHGGEESGTDASLRVLHEIADTAVDWINEVYGPAMQDVFDARAIPYFNYDTYDLFYAGYGDTVPANGFGAAGMTFEKANGDPAPQRVFEQYLTQWTSLSAAAINKERILREWHGSWVEALRQGEAGQLEPNRTYEPGVPVSQPVPARSVRHYFLRADDPDKAREVQALVRRLQRMDVEVRRLTAPLTVPDFRAYGRAPAATTLPTGTYWVPMAQRQKHWVQAMLNESTYTPVGYAYDIVGWSNPLLFNVTGGSSGAVLAPKATVAGAQAEPAPPALPSKRPSVALYSIGPEFARGI